MIVCGHFLTIEERMLEFLRKRWFLVGLLTLISAGMILGANVSSAKLGWIYDLINPRVVTFIVLFLMSFSLDSAQLKRSARFPGPVAWASSVNFIFIPLSGLLLMRFQNPTDFRYGLMVAASVPCTMAAASVWTRKANGNDAVSLLVTILTNGFCFAITPFWLNFAIPGNISFDFWKMVLRLVTAVLVPTLLGQSVRQHRRMNVIARKYKTPLGVVAQSCVLLIVFSAACKAGTRIAEAKNFLNASDIAVVWGTCIGIHLLAMFVAYRGSRLWGFSLQDSIATAFAGSQKTLPIGILLAMDESMFGNPNLLGEGVGVPFVVFPMLMYHASQLFIDTAIADRFARKVQESNPEEVSRKMEKEA